VRKQIYFRAVNLLEYLATFYEAQICVQLVLQEDEMVAFILVPRQVVGNREPEVT
jgi:hypothetical protein